MGNHDYTLMVFLGHFFEQMDHALGPLHSVRLAVGSSAKMISGLLAKCSGDNGSRRSPSDEFFRISEFL